MDTPSVKRRSRGTGDLSPLPLRPAPFGTAAPFAVLVLAAVGTGLAPGRPLLPQEPRRFDEAALIRDLTVLADDSMEGRLAGSAGGGRAREYLVARFAESGAAPVGDERTQPFPLGRGAGGQGTGVNVLGIVPGAERPDRYVVVSAHYDHLGIRGGQVHNGADDNASGSAALLALASYLASNPPRYSHLFVAFDAEELGLRGARAFVSDPPVPLSSILLNVNLDMIGHSEAGELYAAGPHHYPALVPLVEAAASRARLTLRIGHDSPELSARDDWTELSDHAAFHARGVPFVYFGVEDHEDYHRPTDTVESLTLDFYMDAVEAILDFLLIVDREAEQLG